MRSVTIPAITILLFITVLALGLHVLELARQAADREADRQASLRVLSDFHRSFLGRKHLSREFLEELHKYQEEHPGLGVLGSYARNLELALEGEE